VVIERSSSSSKDEGVPHDRSRSSPPSSHPSTSLVPSVVALIVLDAALPITHLFSRGLLIRHTSWLVSQCDYQLSFL